MFRGQNLFTTTNALARVEVLNGTQVAGQAASVAGELDELGFSVVGTGDDPGHRGVTELRYPRGGLLPAVLLARYLGVNVPFVEVPADEVGPDTGVILVTGSDWSGLRAEPLPSEAFQRYLDQFAAEVAADEAAGRQPANQGGLTVGDLEGTSGGASGEASGGQGAPVAPSITTTTVTPERFVPTPPDGVDCG